MTNSNCFGELQCADSQLCACVELLFEVEIVLLPFKKHLKWFIILPDQKYGRAFWGECNVNYFKLANHH